MGKGIAKEFRDRYRQVEQLPKQNKNVGQCAHIKQGKRNIYYMVTKDKSNEKPKYENVFKTINNLRETLESQKIQYLTLPKIACGLDGLDWKIIKAMIYLKTYKYVYHEKFL